MILAIRHPTISDESSANEIGSCVQYGGANRDRRTPHSWSLILQFYNRNGVEAHLLPQWDVESSALIELFDSQAMSYEVPNDSP